MSRPAKFSAEVIQTAKGRLSKAATMAELRAAQVILLPALFGLTREQTAEAVGLSSSRVGGLQAEARQRAHKLRHTHGGRRRQRMTVEQERAFLAPWEEQAATAGMIIVPPLHQALEKHLGAKIHASQVYRMLARHGWRKVAPDSIHPKTDEQAQDAWKKNSRKWYPKH
jgi:transposase